MNAKQGTGMLLTSIGSLLLAIALLFLCMCACMGNLTYKDPKTKKNELTGFTISEIVCGSIGIILLIPGLILYFKKS